MRKGIVKSMINQRGVKEMNLVKNWTIKETITGTSLGRDWRKVTVRSQKEIRVIEKIKGILITGMSLPSRGKMKENSTVSFCTYINMICKMYPVVV